MKEKILVQKFLSNYLANILEIWWSIQILHNLNYNGTGIFMHMKAYRSILIWKDFTEAERNHALRFDFFKFDTLNHAMWIIPIKYITVNIAKKLLLWVTGLT